MKKISSHRAQWALLFVSFLWGLTFPLIRQAVAHISPFSFVLFRFSLAFLIFLPIVLFSSSFKKKLKFNLLSGLFLGGILCVSYFSQTFGLQFVESGRAAFVTGTNVVLVPLLAPWFGLKKPTLLDIGAAGLALLGIYLMTDPSGEGFNQGDAWILLCSFSYAIYLLFLQKILLRKGVDHSSLVFFQILGVVALCSLGIPWGPSLQFPSNSVVWVALLFCSLFATVGTFWLQTHFQGETTAHRAALIFSTEPIFASLFGFFLLGETLSLSGYFGALLILFAVWGQSSFSVSSKK